MALGEKDVPDSIIGEAQVQKGIHALCEYVKKKQSNAVGSLLGEPEKISLQVCLGKVPKIKNKIIKLVLPHSLVVKNTDVCLFVKDLDKNERDTSNTIDFFKNLLEEKGVKNIPEIIPLRAVKTEYQPYEAKKNLSNMYDAFLTDARIARLLPALLGKNFYGRKRFPLQINLESSDLNKEYSKVLSMTQCILAGRGSSCQMSVAHTGQSESDAVDNVMAAIEKLLAELPGGKDNVKNIHLRTVDSPSIPLYVSTGSFENVKLPTLKRKLTLDEPEEVTGVEHGKVRVTPYGKIQIIKDPTENTKSPKDTSKQEHKEKKAKKIVKKTKKVATKVTKVQKKKQVAEKEVQKLEKKSKKSSIKPGKLGKKESLTKNKKKKMLR